ncbi:putative protein 40 [Haloarcula hispanica icosahedral virus 2]|uniref:Uncharacterized protein n=1 Tax=Haloarcula hispanica icosahedral virus 2 TaxID=1154689 RepID=H9AZZ6_9VIRU|nr:putative protein 40 [Haloarcula hispanica icosahedral virus 2]AFD02321.1 putative protein 40 [Haloarcula hispanica icosahedral virus 2]
MSDTNTSDEMEHRTCEQCNYTRLADAEEAPADVPVEAGGDGETHRRVWTLCDRCRREVAGTVRPCPYCLESLGRRERAADCPEAPEMFTGTVVSDADPLILDDGTVTVSVDDAPGTWDLGDVATAVGEYVGNCGPYAARMDADEVREGEP